MLEYEFLRSLFEFLVVPRNFKKHWNDNFGWQMAEFINQDMLRAIVKVVVVAQYVALSYDEVSTLDNQSLLSIHCYVVQNWVKIPIFISLDQVLEGNGNDNLTKMIMEVFTIGGGMPRDQVSTKLINFGVEGVNVFQGTKFGVTKQTHDDHVFNSIGVHCMAHHTNLTMQTLSSLLLGKHIESLLQTLHAYFAHSLT